MPDFLKLLFVNFLIILSVSNLIQKAGSVPSLFKKTTKEEFIDDKKEESQQEDVFKSLEAHVYSLKKFKHMHGDENHIKNIPLLFGCLEKESKYEDCDKINDFR